MVKEIMKKERIAGIALLVVALALIFWPNKQTPIETIVETETPIVETGAPRTESSIIGSSSFKLVSHNGFNVPLDEEYILTFKDGSVHAKFCNNLSALYTLKDGFIKSEGVMSTKMFCSTPAKVMQAESTLSNLLTSGSGISLKQNTLVISNGRDLMVFDLIR